MLNTSLWGVLKQKYSRSRVYPISRTATVGSLCRLRRHARTAKNLAARSSSPPLLSLRCGRLHPLARGKLNASWRKFFSRCYCQVSLYNITCVLAFAGLCWSAAQHKSGCVGLARLLEHNFQQSLIDALSFSCPATNGPLFFCCSPHSLSACAFPSPTVEGALSRSFGGGLKTSSGLRHSKCVTPKRSQQSGMIESAAVLAV